MRYQLVLSLVFMICVMVSIFYSFILTIIFFFLECYFYKAFLKEVKRKREEEHGEFYQFFN